MFQTQQIKEHLFRKHLFYPLNADDKCQHLDWLDADDKCQHIDRP
jgi:hypothetical protein